MIKLLFSHVDKNESLNITGEEPVEFLADASNELSQCNSVMTYDITGQKLTNGILVTGSVSTILDSSCGRCLKKISIPVSTEFSYFYDDISEGEIDLTERIREDFLLDFPQTFICDDACKGFCYMCGVNLNEKECSCEPEEIEEDNPWSALDNLKV
jgi:uncharacterized metal-binding protein YceD (DUF177 family)